MLTYYIFIFFFYNIPPLFGIEVAALTLKGGGAVSYF